MMPHEKCKLKIYIIAIPMLIINNPDRKISVSIRVYSTNGKGLCHQDFFLLIKDVI